ncbi:MAG TPA: heparan-alpha-glucosaminide N-acetyltransferase domain-containing protein [Acidimicrobiales bacterium]
MSRDAALDRLRGIALVGMLLHHVTAWLTGTDARGVIPGWTGFVVTDVAAPAFFVAAGMSASLLVASRRRRGMPAPRIAGQVLRRYGLLVPLGVGLRWVLGWNTDGFGVLEALGVTVLLAVAVAAILPTRLEPVAAVAFLAAGILVERALFDRTDWWSAELLAGKFPLFTYVGFVLLGMAAVDSQRHRSRGWALVAVGVGAVAFVALLAAGHAPDRYPGDLKFVIPGLFGTAAAYAIAQRSWSKVAAPVDSMVRSAAAHTLGIFLAHYILFEVAERLGLGGPVSAPVAVTAAVVVTLVLCAVAPRVPQSPWSPRTGWRHPPAAPEPPPVADRPVCVETPVAERRGELVGAGTS